MPRGPVPRLHPLHSSSVHSVGYDDATSELHVRFVSSSDVYVYAGVPADVYRRLLAAPSKGTFVNREIKDVYAFRKRGRR